MGRLNYILRAQPQIDDRNAALRAQPHLLPAKSNFAI